VVGEATIMSAQCSWELSGLEWCCVAKDPYPIVRPWLLTTYRFMPYFSAVSWRLWSSSKLNRKYRLHFHV
jgi:hypothetical protein